jgi:3-oxoacyl-[acyl-carrier protein] reductase
MTADTLAGKIALVTGGSRGIGRAIALSLAQAGASIAINYRRREDEAVRVCEEVMRCGRRCLLVQANVADAREVAQMIETIEKDLGAIDILAVNLKSVFLVTQAGLPGMRSRRWGRIINMSSVAVRLGGIIGPHYTASKAGVEGLTRAYAARLAREGITVNAVAPALIETDMIAGHQQAKTDRVPVGRRGAPEEVAMVVTMLASNGFMTGQIIAVNGGMSMA